MKEDLSEATVFVVDDDPHVRDSTRWLLESSGFHVRVFPDAASFQTAFDPERPGCIVLDIRMPDRNGLGLQEDLMAGGVEIPVIFITAHGDVPQSVQAMRRGAWDFLEKPYDPRQLVATVEAAVRHDLKRHRSSRKQVAYSGRFARLTPREREVALEVAGGRSSKEVARRLGLSPRTVDVHRYRLMEKMQARSVAHLVKMLVQLGEEIPEPEEPDPDLESLM